MDILVSKMETYNLEEVLTSISKDFEKNKLQYIKHNVYLTNYEIEILNQYEIDYEICYSQKELLQKIENKMRYLEEEEQDELEQVLMNIAERDYYQNTRK